MTRATLTATDAKVAELDNVLCQHVDAIGDIHRKHTAFDRDLDDLDDIANDHADRLDEHDDALDFLYGKVHRIGGAMTTILAGSVVVLAAGASMGLAISLVQIFTPALFGLLAWGVVKLVQRYYAPVWDIVRGVFFTLITLVIVGVILIPLILFFMVSWLIKPLRPAFVKFATKIKTLIQDNFIPSVVVPAQ
jgi:hypothetical protein